MADNTKVYSIKIDGIEENVNGVKSLKDQTNDYAKAVRETNKEIKSLQGQMLGLDKGSSQWIALAKEAGNLKDKVNDAREAINRYASDTKALDDVINVAQSATAAFTLAKGAMSAFGLETEGAVKAIQQLQGAMAIIQSLQALQNTLKGSSVTATLLTKSMNLLSFGIKGTTTATKALKVAMMSIGIGLVITAVSVLVEHWEDLVGWLNKTFPVLNKVGGVMNGLKGILRGVGEAILHWFINPWKTAADVMKKLFSGDFEGAVEAAKEGLKRQFTGMADSFNNGFKKQVEIGLEDITRKQAAEADKQLTHQKNMITKQKNADGTYRKEYIEANKKMFDNRKKMYKKDSDEYKKVLEDEAQFNQQIEDAKEAASKKASAERTKAAKAAADAEKKAQEETLKAIEKAEEAWKKYTDVRHEVGDAILDQQILELKLQERLQKRRLESYASGPIDRYMKELQKLYSIQEQIANLDQAKAINDISKSLADNIKYLNKDTEAWKRFEQAQYDEIKNKALEAGKSLEEAEKYAEISAANIENIWTQMFDQMIKMTDEERYALLDSLGYNEKIQKELVNLSNARTEKEKADAEERLNTLKTEQTQILNSWQKINAMIIQSADENNAKFIESQNQAITVMKNELDDYANDAERSYEWLMKRIKDIDVEPVTKDNVWGKLFGVIDEKETLEKYERIKKLWVRAYNEIQDAINKSEEKWDLYLRNVAAIYGQDSIQYKKAIQEKMDALEKLRKKALEVGKVANAETSTSVDYSGGDKKDKKKHGNKFMNFENNGGVDWGGIKNTIEDAYDAYAAPILEGLGDSIHMMMELAIEEAQDALDEATEIHDKAVDKVEKSKSRLSEINQEMQTASATRLEELKAQQADEMTLLAQREAEEKRAEREKERKEQELERKKKQQRKMELQIQMAQAVASGALAVVNGLATVPFVPVGIAMGALAATSTALQIAVLAKQMSKLADGGLLSGPSHSKGGIPVGNTGIEVEGGEYVVNKRSTAKYLPLLQQINEEGARKKTVANQIGKMATRKNTVANQIGKMANGGQLNYNRVSSSLSTQDIAKVIQTSVGAIDMHPTVSVVDINREQKNLTTVRQMAGTN